MIITKKLSLALCALLEFVLWTLRTYFISALLHQVKNFLSWNVRIVMYDSRCQLYIRTTKKCLKIEFALSFALWIWPLNYMNTLFMHFIFYLQKPCSEIINSIIIFMAIKLNKHAVYLLTVSMILFYFFFSPISILGKKYIRCRVGAWLRLMSDRPFPLFFPI